jgi:hypothetical protein
MTYDVGNPDPGLGQTPKSILIVKCFISNMYIFTLISLNDIVSTSELTLTLKIIVTNKYDDVIKIHYRIT